MKDKYSREELEGMAAEMNDVMGLTPFMDFNMPDDDTLYTTIVNEATGRGIVKDAIRADDFESANPEKRLFSADALHFFTEAGVWDADKKSVIMPKAAGKPAAAAPVEKKAAKPVAKAEAAAQDKMEAGEAEPELPLAGKPEPVAKTAKKKDGKAAPAAGAAQAPEAKEEPVGKTKATKNGAAKKTAAKKVPKEKKEKVEREPSAYGTALDIMCAHPDMTMDQLGARMKQKGFDVVAKKGAIGTAFSSVRTILAKVKEAKKK